MQATVRTTHLLENNPHFGENSLSAWHPSQIVGTRYREESLSEGGEFSQMEMEVRQIEIVGEKKEQKGSEQVGPGAAQTARSRKETLQICHKPDSHWNYHFRNQISAS